LKPKVHLPLGGCYASAKPVEIRTVLGSCVGVCLHDPRARIGGLNHIVLPGQADFNTWNNPTRYAVNAMEVLINMVLELGGQRSRLTAKAFGGAHLFASISKSNGVGQKNIAFVREFLRQEGIPLIASDLGGFRGRTILFHSDTGDVYLRRLPKTLYAPLTEAERRFMERSKKEAQEPTDVTLF
jgi:chemotaxis protein CheD